jgi:hypothetical protein
MGLTAGTISQLLTRSVPVREVLLPTEELRQSPYAQSYFLLIVMVALDEID